jgi:hypothetical protein
MNFSHKLPATARRSFEEDAINLGLFEGAMLKRCVLVVPLRDAAVAEDHGFGAFSNNPFCCRSSVSG